MIAPSKTLNRTPNVWSPFHIDEKGGKIALQRHRALWENFYDNHLADKRENEPRSTFADVKARLIKAGSFMAKYALTPSRSADQ